MSSSNLRCIIIALCGRRRARCVPPPCDPNCVPSRRAQGRAAREAEPRERCGGKVHEPPVGLSVYRRALCGQKGNEWEGEEDAIALFFPPPPFSSLLPTLYRDALYHVRERTGRLRGGRVQKGLARIRRGKARHIHAYTIRACLLACLLRDSNWMSPPRRLKLDAGGILGRLVARSPPLWSRAC